jgi:large-conductance mechanosensitive channel
MNDLISELIGFSIVAIVVIMLAFFTSKLQKRFENEQKSKDNDKKE